MIVVYLVGWAIVAVATCIFAAIVAADSTNQSDRNMAWSLPFIGIAGGGLWPLAIVAGVLGAITYGGWHTARAIKHKGWDY